MERPPIKTAVVDKDGKLTKEWANWITKMWTVGGAHDNSGTTAHRPTTDLYIGRFYLDATLGKPIFCSGINPTVWVDAAGTVV